MAEYNGCLGCKHRASGGMTCPAFPSGIPLNIASGQIKHTRVLPGQEGAFVWEAKASDRKNEKKKRSDSAIARTHKPRIYAIRRRAN